MDILKVNTWQNASGALMSMPFKFTAVAIPSSSASASLGYVSSLAGFTTSNTANLHSFNYTPYSATSNIMWMMTIDCDRNGSGNAEHVCMFVDNVCYSSSYLYPRNSGNEPYQHIQSGTYTNSSTANKTFAIRGASGAGWTQSIGASPNDNALANCVLIWEYPR
jgi:hypothetical protein